MTDPTEQFRVLMQATSDDNIALDEDCEAADEARYRLSLFVASEEAVEEIAHILSDEGPSYEADSVYARAILALLCAKALGDEG